MFIGCICLYGTCRNIFQHKYFPYNLRTNTLTALFSSFCVSTLHNLSVVYYAPDNVPTLMAHHTHMTSHFWMHSSYVVARMLMTYTTKHENQAVSCLYVIFCTMYMH